MCLCVCVFDCVGGRGEWALGCGGRRRVGRGEGGLRREEGGGRVVPQHMVGPDSLDPIWTSTAVQVRSGGVNTKIVLT